MTLDPSKFSIPHGSITIKQPPFSEKDIKLVERIDDKAQGYVKYLFKTPKGELATAFTYDCIYLHQISGVNVEKMAVRAVLKHLNEGEEPVTVTKSWGKAIEEPHPKISGFTVVKRLYNAIPGLTGAKAKCPCEADCSRGGETVPVVDLVMHLNDQAKWSRERIADWLESLDFDLRFHTPTEGEEDGHSHR